MRDQEALIAISVVLTTVGGATAIFGMWQKERRARRQERHELLPTALQHPQLDEITRAELLRTIAREQDSGVPRLFGVLRTVWFAIGWMMFVAGGCGLLLNALRVVRADNDVTASFAVAGFAMLSLPLGPRELTRRDSTVAGKRA